MTFFKKLQRLLHITANKKSLLKLRYKKKVRSPYELVKGNKIELVYKHKHILLFEG